MRSIFSMTVALAGLLANHAAASAQTERFHLVFYGHEGHAGEHEVSPDRSAAPRLARAIAEGRSPPSATASRSVWNRYPPSCARGKGWVELLEVAVRHQPAGIMKADWLEIILQAP